MTILEKKSKRKATAIKNLVENGEYSPSYALMVAEDLNDTGKLLDVDYEPLAEWLEELINKPEEEEEETNEEKIEDSGEENGIDNE